MMRWVSIVGLILGVAGCGSDGDSGARGADGRDGQVGADGAKGDNGLDGEDGADGQDGAAGEPAPLSALALPGEFFPESMNAGADGTLYVSSLAIGAVYRVSPDRRTVAELVPAEDGIGKLGVLADEERDALWVCTANLQTFASTLRRYDLRSGEQQAELPMVAGVCNDLALDAEGNLYVTDSFVGIERLAAGSDELEAWSTDPLYQAGEGEFAVDGIVLDGDNVYVNNLTKGTLIRVPLEASGDAGTPRVIADVTLTAPDGMRLRSEGTILVAESTANTLSQIVVDAESDTGTRTVLSNRLDRPSAVAISGDTAWVAEGQIGRFVGADETPLNVPFLVSRVPLL